MLTYIDSGVLIAAANGITRPPALILIARAAVLPPTIYHGVLAMKPKPTAKTSAAPQADKSERESEPDTPPENISPLGRRLRKILQEMEEAGEAKNLSWEEIEQEIISRRTGIWEPKP